jgi:K(+)-stimulated pyrophosphate-energized sodium pump
VAISTEASIKKMLLPGAITIIAPLVIGFAFGPEALGGFLAGATVSGVLMGMFQNNAGGAWDNAKKSFEKGVEINGEVYYKKSEPHKASVTGDTVGDPFKDTSGPSMNILIKLMSIVSLVIAPTLAQIHGTGGAHGSQIKTKEVSVTIVNGDAPAAPEAAADQPLVDALKNDGVITGTSYTIELDNGVLKVDGKEVDQAKYKDLIKGDKIKIEVREK